MSLTGSCNNQGSFHHLPKKSTARGRRQGREEVEVAPVAPPGSTSPEGTSGSKIANGTKQKFVVIKTPPD
jgi:hypothetical protein